MHLSNSLLHGLISPMVGKSGIDPAAGAEAGKAGGDFSGLLSLFTLASGGKAAVETPGTGKPPASKGDGEPALPLDAATPPTGSAMPPVAASGKILPAILPENVPAVISADGIVPKAESAETPPIPSKGPQPSAPFIASAMGDAQLPAAPRPAANEDDAQVEGAPAPASAVTVEISAAERPTPTAGPIDMIVEIAPAPASDPADIDQNAGAQADKAAVAPQPRANMAAVVSPIVLPLPIAAAHIMVGEDTVQSDAASPSPAPLPPVPARHARMQAAMRRDGQPLAAQTQRMDPALSSGEEAPALTLRMAQREQPAAMPADARPANGERHSAAASATQVFRLPAAIEGDTQTPKMPALAASAGIHPSSPMAAPIVSAPADAGPVAPMLRAPGVEPMADLAQIVDRLAAAREALTPARAALSIDHAEFGELTLRFEQRHDGRLMAELAGANADAHRAVAQAMAADRSEAGTAQQQSPQQQSSSQSMRASAGERDAGGSNGSAGDQRQDTARQRGGRGAEQHRSQGGSGHQQTGVFA